MAEPLHLDPNYQSGTHTVKGCHHCSWVGHVDYSNAPRVAMVDEAGVTQYVPDLTKCPGCGRDLYRDRDRTGLGVEDDY